MSYYTEKQYKIEERGHVYRFIYQPFFKEVQGPILDIGCSMGNFVACALEKIQGVDIDSDALKICKKRNLKAEETDISTGITYPDNTFNGVFCSHVIEHLEDPLNLVKEIHRILKENGLLILITQDYTVTHDKDPEGFWSDYTHRKPFTKSSLRRIAMDGGFNDVKVQHFHRPFKGMGFLVRRRIVSPKKLLSIQNRLGIKSKDLLLITKK